LPALGAVVVVGAVVEVAVAVRVVAVLVVAVVVDTKVTLEVVNVFELTVTVVLVALDVDEVTQLNSRSYASKTVFTVSGGVSENRSQKLEYARNVKKVQPASDEHNLAHALTNCADVLRIRKSLFDCRLFAVLW
jgi:hypothetical protein